MLAVAKASIIRSSSKLFTGRESYLQMLSAFFRAVDIPRTQKIALLHGIGGIGKTQICLKFLEANPDLCANHLFPD